MRRVLSSFLLVAACTAKPATPAVEVAPSSVHDMSKMAVPASPAAGAGHEGHTTNEVKELTTEVPSGLAEIAIPLDRQQLIGVKTGRAEVGPLGSHVRASGSVQADERKDAHVHSKLMGWVQELFVNSVGQRVEKGAPLYALYSQELFTAQQEYLRARRSTPELAAAGRQRLLLWDVPEDQVKLIETKGPRQTLVFRSPVAGTVLEKAIVKGHYLEPDMMLYRIADLSEVWIVANLYEYEVNRIDRTAPSAVEVQGVAGSFLARIDFVYPTLDEATRTVKVRLVAPNPAGTLRPGSFATVDLPTRGGEVVWVPDAALIDTGERQVVYLALPEGRFRPRQVVAGRRGEGRVEIVRGLNGGEEVVISAQFLVDSESRLRGAGSPNAGGHQGHQ